ncbi:hypothetical protein PMAYCL1PPCAC_11345, partial [Pristionchus mayeri]
LVMSFLLNLRSYSVAAESEARKEQSGNGTCLIVLPSMRLMMAGSIMNSLGLIHPFSLSVCFAVNDKNPSGSVNGRAKLIFSVRSTLSYKRPLIIEFLPRTLISYLDNPCPRFEVVGAAGTGIADFPHKGGTHQCRERQTAG